MKKRLSIFALFLTVNFSVFGQLSDRVSDPSTYKFGTRPSAGTKVLTFGVDVNDETLTKQNLLGKGNLITGKYFLNDDLAIRGGLRLSRTSDFSKGDIDTSLSGGNTLSNKYKESSREYVLVPGIEKHFGYSNIFDVYAGSDLYLGFGRDVTENNEDYSGNMYSYTKTTTGKTVVGLGGIIGVNVFVLDLPIALGVEYGWTGIWNFGGKTKVVNETNDGSRTTTQEYYTQDNDGLGNVDNNYYSKLSKRSSNIDTNNNLRLILSIYFN
ncbi:MAG TPA: hypothetical protein VIK89_06270 [Cytophagaceae bacterium]